MAPQTNTEEIIEKKATAPVATSCLIIAAVALLCAIALQIAEIAEYRSGLASTNPNPGLEQAKKDANKYKEEIGDILSKAPKTEGEAAAPKAGAEPAEAPADEDAGVDAKADDAGTKAEPAETKEAAEGADEADAKADAADTKADAKEAEETPADEAGDEAADEKAGE
jgi:hypothetical protein